MHVVLWILISPYHISTKVLCSMWFILQHNNIKLNNKCNYIRIIKFTIYIYFLKYHVQFNAILNIYLQTSINGFIVKSGQYCNILNILKDQKEYPFIQLVQSSLYFFFKGVPLLVVLGQVLNTSSSDSSLWSPKLLAEDIVDGQ